MRSTWRGTSRWRQILAAAALAAFTSYAPAQDVTTAHNDNSRSGVQANETVLTPSNVSANAFGKLFSMPVLGDIYAQPLYISQYTMADGQPHNVLFVATQEDYVYAFDADGNNPAQGYLWRRSLLGTGETWVRNSDVGSTDISPNIGITGTPVINRRDAVLYVVAKSKTSSGTTFFQRLHALSLADGSEKLNGPTTIQAKVPGLGDGGTTVSFNARTNNQRAALLLTPTPGTTGADSVFIAWASHGDLGQYHGWVIGYNADDISQQTAAWADTPGGKSGGIWMSGGGLSSDDLGNIFAAGGNGTFDANAGGADYGDSAFHLTIGTSGLTLADYFTPADQSSLSTSDRDMGTSAAVLLPTQSGTVPHLMVTTDKSATIYLLNRDNMGGYGTPYNSSLQSFGVGSTVHNSFAFFNNAIYLAGDGGQLKAWAFNPATERFGTTPQSHSLASFGCAQCDGGGSTPSVSANGSTNGIVWALNNSGFGATPAVLHAYNPANLATEYYNSTQAANSRDAAAVAVKFTTPTIANGKVYVGGRNTVTVYGLFNPNAPQTAAPTFSPAAGTYTSGQSVTISSTTPNASIYYTTDGSPASTGSTLYTGPVNVGISETLQAVAIAPGFSQSAVSPSDYTIRTAGFGQGAVAYGSGFFSGSLLLNGSADVVGSRLRLTDGLSSEAGSAYFQNKVNVQGFTNDFDFQLTNPKADGFTFVIQNAGGSALGYVGGALGYGPGQIAGTPGIKSSLAVKFDLYSNAGEGGDSTGLYTNGVLPTKPAIDLTTTGINLHSGDLFHVHMAYDGTTLSVTTTDATTNASATQSYTVNIPSIVGGTTAYVGFTGATGGSAATQDILNWVYAPVPCLPSPITAASGLKLNGAATFAAAGLQLTNAVKFEASSAFFPTTVNVSNFTTKFTFQLTNPGGDGFTFVIQQAGTTALGGSASKLGYGGITPSVAVKFDLYNNAGEGRDSTGLYTDGATPTLPAINLTGSGIDLHSGHVFSAQMAYDGTTLTVTITDTSTNVSATQAYTVDIPTIVGGKYAYVGFTGSTGGLTATQDILTWMYQ